jgi:hypothetical protein
MQRVCGRRVLLLVFGLSLLVALSAACGRKRTVEQIAVDRITVEEVKARLDNGEAITFIDSRSDGAWADAVAKIPGALRIPPHDIPADISHVPKDKPVVVYCT